MPSVTFCYYIKKKDYTKYMENKKHINQVLGKCLRELINKS